MTALIIGGLLVILGFALYSVKQEKNKTPSVLVAVALFLIVIAGFQSYIFTELQEFSSDSGKEKKEELKKIENHIRQEVSQRKIDILSEKYKFVKAERSTSISWAQFFSLLNVIVTVAGLGVAGNYLTEATLNKGATPNYYEIPREIYNRIDRLEKTQITTNRLLFMIVLLLLLNFIIS